MATPRGLSRRKIRKDFLLQATRLIIILKVRDIIIWSYSNFTTV